MRLLKQVKEKKRLVAGILIIALLVVGAAYYFYSQGYFKTEPFVLTREQIRKEKISLANANNSSYLETGQAAIVQKKQPHETGEKKSENILLPEGSTYTIEAAGDVDAQLFGGGDLVPKGPDTTIIDLEEDAGTGEEKIEPAIENRFAKDPKTTVPVIIEYEKKGKTYYEEPDLSEKKEIEKELERDKRRTKRLFEDGFLRRKANGLIKDDLLIANAVSAEINADAVDDLRQSPDIRRVWLDRQVRATLNTSVSEIHAGEVYNFIDNNSNPIRGRGIKIGIIDTGVDYSHSDLGGCLGEGCKVIGGYDFVGRDNDPIDDHGHGTHVAAIAAGSGMLDGVAPDASVVAYKVLDTNGSGLISDVIAAIERSGDPDQNGDSSDRLDVVNLSLGGRGNPDDLTSKAVDKISALGVVVVVAAGNSGPRDSTIESPGTARTAITVAASCQPSQIGDGYCIQAVAVFSSRGPLNYNGEDIPKPDISAPGVSICAARQGTAFAGEADTCLNDTHVRLSGTSMATPHLAGAAALLKQSEPTLTPAQIKQRIKDSAISLGLEYEAQGAGLVNVASLLQKTSDLSASPSNWSVDSNPQNRYSASSQAFTISKTGQAANPVDLIVSADIAGVVLSANKETLNLAPSDSFTLTLNVDNDIVRAGYYSASILLRLDGAVKYSIPVKIHILPTIEISPSLEMDYGIDPPSQTQWTSSRNFTLKNFRTDISKEVPFSLSQFPSAVAITGEAASAVTLLPSETREVPVAISVANGNLANGQYKGIMIAGDYKIHVKFTKYFKAVAKMINLPASSNQLVVRAESFFYDRSNQQNDWANDIVEKFVTEGDNDIFTDGSGPYDVITRVSVLHYDPNFVGSSTYFIFNESLKQNDGDGSIEFTVDFNSANHKVKKEFKDINGNRINDLGSYSMGAFYRPHGRGIRLYGTWSWNEPNDSFFNDFYFSDMSSDYSFGLVSVREPQPTQVAHLFSLSFNGINDDILIKNEPSDFITREIDVRNTDYYQSKYPTDILNSVLSVIYAPLGGGSAFTAFISRKSSRVWNTVRIYALPFEDMVGQHSILSKDRGMPVQHSYQFNPSSNKITSYYFADESRIRTLVGGRFQSGFTPKHWNGMFVDNFYRLNVWTYWPADSSYFIGQDYSVTDSDASKIRLVKEGTEVVNKNLSGFMIGDYPKIIEEFSQFSNIPGSVYEFYHDSLISHVDGKEFHAKVYAKFDSGKTDPNPPSIARLNFFTAGKYSEFYYPQKSNSLEFELDDGGLGEYKAVANVNSAYSTDGTNFNDMALVLADLGGYKAEIPVGLTTNDIITFRIGGFDESGNLLEYTFEVPVKTNPSVTLSVSREFNRDVPIPVTAVFDRAVSGFELSDIQVVNGTVSGLTTADNKEYSFFVYPINQGNVSVNILANTANDSEGNGNIASSQLTLFYDSVAPVVSAGADKSVSGAFTQEGSATDPAPGSGIASYSWSKVSGPGNVSFGQPNSPVTAVQTDGPGRYTLRLAAVDKANNSASDDFVLTSTLPPPPPAAVSLLANGQDNQITVERGSAVNISWNLTSVTTCTPLSGDSGWRAQLISSTNLTGIYSTTVNTNTRFVLRCNSAAGTVEDSVVVSTIMIVSLEAGDCYFGGNNAIEASLFCQDDIIVDDPGNVEFRGSFVANKFDIAGINNVRFVYDYMLSQFWPPGFRYLNIPLTKEK